MKIGNNRRNIQWIYIALLHGCGYPIDEKQIFFTPDHESGNTYITCEYTRNI